MVIISRMSMLEELQLALEKAQESTKLKLIKLTEDTNRIFKDSLKSIILEDISLSGNSVIGFHFLVGEYVCDHLNYQTRYIRYPIKNKEPIKGLSSFIIDYDNQTIDSFVESFGTRYFIKQIGNKGAGEILLDYGKQPSYEFKKRVNAVLKNSSYPDSTGRYDYKFLPEEDDILSILETENE